MLVNFFRHIEHVPLPRIVQNSVIKCLVKDVPQVLDIICLILLIMTRISFIITLIVLRMTFIESMNLCMKFCIDIHGYCFKQTYHSLLWKWISCFILLFLSYMGQSTLGSPKQDWILSSACLLDLIFYKTVSFHICIFYGYLISFRCLSSLCQVHTQLAQSRLVSYPHIQRLSQSVGAH